MEPGGCRVVTTSVRDDHLRVLWGEIDRCIDLYYKKDGRPQFLDSKRGGPLLRKHRDIRFLLPDGRLHQISYLVGIVSKQGEGMAGHHAAHTLWIADECSGVADIAYDMILGWAKRVLLIGNPNETQNFYRKAVEGGDILVGDKPKEGLAADINLED